MSKYLRLPLRDNKVHCCLVRVFVVFNRVLFFVSTGWYDENTYDATVPLLSQEENPAYEVCGGGGGGGGHHHKDKGLGLPPPPTLPKPLSKPAKPRVRTSQQSVLVVQRLFGTVIELIDL